jgi:transposase
MDKYRIRPASDSVTSFSDRRSPQFKAKVALGAMRGEHTLA